MMTAVCVRVCVYMCVISWVCVHLCMYAYLCECTWVCVFVVCVCMCGCACVCLYFSAYRYFISNHVGRLGHFVAACAMFGTMLRFFSVNHKEVQCSVLPVYIAVTHSAFNRKYQICLLFWMPNLPLPPSQGILLLAMLYVFSS